MNPAPHKASNEPDEDISLWLTGFLPEVKPHVISALTAKFTDYARQERIDLIQSLRGVAIDGGEDGIVLSYKQVEDLLAELSAPSATTNHLPTVSIDHQPEWSSDTIYHGSMEDTQSKTEEKI
jgi:hypothetical protein